MDEMESNPIHPEPMRGLHAEVARLKRERARLRGTVSFQLGLHLTTAIRKPWRFPLLPITFPLLCLRLGLQKIGRAPHPPLAGLSSIPMTPRRRSVVLFPTNGVGFGHFTRMYALARRLRQQDPDLEIVMFTSMPTLHVPYADDFVTYHLAGRKKHGDLSASAWNGLLEDMLRVVLDLHKPAVFVFDGAFPYRGMLNAIQGEEHLCKLWMKRGMFRAGARVPVDSTEFFDSLIYPGDAVVEQSTSLPREVEELWVNPMLVYEPSELLERSTVRRRLGLPSSARVVYVQLGAGRINDIHSEIRLVVDALLSNSDIHVVLGESMLGERLEFDLERVQILRDYPNMLMFNAFDYSIQAGGYNSFHEMRSLQIPTLFLPNMETGMDDQKARCDVAVKEGWGLVNEDRSARALASDVERLLSLPPGAGPISDTLNGAEQVASIVQEKVNAHVGV